MPATRKYRVDLSEQEQQRLHEITRRGKVAARTITRARILLLSYEGLSDDHILKVLGVGSATLTRVRRRYVTEGLDAALHERPRPGARPKMKQEHVDALQALLSTPPPEGQKQWSLRLLAAHLVEQHHVERISHETIRSTLQKSKKTQLHYGVGTKLQDDTTRSSRPGGPHIVHPQISLRDHE